ncbi:MAG: prenyltransferase/squalene oxidase repeat-containing protein [Solirubrobacterales bacterium]
MSWQIGTLVVLMLALGGGMLWYETSRPPSQIVALVAVLAALAVAGRIVLAPIPNVVATTDIVFFAGFALGPAPGFAVGALGGLVSNFWLGQGVWTPWQMVGWGMTGVAGGAFWHLTRGRANRFTLALACGAAGLVFGAWMNFQTMVSFGGEMSLDRYLVLEARAIPFDLAHITGNVIFALVAGPTMVGALRRFRERFEWQQATSVAGVLLVVAALGTVVMAPAPATAAQSAEVVKGANWLKAQQNDDGGFGSISGEDSSLNITARSMIALAAADINPLDVKKANVSPYGYLVSRKNDIDSSADLALVILALRTVGSNPKNFEGRNLVQALNGEGRRGSDYSYHNKVNTAAFAALAFQSAQATGPRDNVVEWLRSAQNDDGGWGISDEAKSDPDSTGATLQAVGGDKTVRQAMSYLKSIQKSNGGFASFGTVNTQSTGLVVQGAVANGKGKNYPHRYGPSGHAYLLNRQQEDGSMFYAEGQNQSIVWVTADTLPALAGESLPVSAPPREPKDDPADDSNSNGGATPGTGGSTTTPTYTPDLSGSGSSSSSSSPTPSSSPPTISERSAAGANSGGTNPGAGNDTGESAVPPAAVVPVVPVAPPSAAVLAASEAGSSPSAIIATLICLVVTGGLAGGTVLLARRFQW